MKRKSQTVFALSILYFQANGLSKAERAIIAALVVGKHTETLNFSKSPIVSLAEKGYVVFGKTAKLTAKGRKIADICLAEATG